MQWKWILWKWKQRLRAGKLEEEAVKLKMSWLGQSSRWGAGVQAITEPNNEVFDLEQGVGPEDIQRSRVSTIIWFSVLFVPQEGKRWIFWTSGLTGRFLGYDVSRHLSEVIHPYFICVVSSPTVTCKSAALYLCCIYVMALAQARKKSQICRTISIWSTVDSFYCIIKESNMLLS